MASRKVPCRWSAVSEYAAKTVAAKRLDITMGTYVRVWPARIALGEWYGNVDERAKRQRAFRESAEEAGCSIITTNKKEGRIALETITAVAIPSESCLVHVSGLASDIAECKRRRHRIEAGFPWLSASEIREAVSILISSSVDRTLFNECCAFGAALHERDVAGMTPRQVDIEGLHTKWLDKGKNRHIVTLLSGKEDLGLVDRPKHVRFSYIDPVKRGSGGRVHDSADSDDCAAPAYRPRTVVICENRDCAHEFPAQVADGISVMGDGDGAPGLIAAFEWISQAETLWYWGDMDADGLEILAAVRKVCPDTRSIFMDTDSYERYEHLGVSAAADGRALCPRQPKEIAGFLSAREYELYVHLCSKECRGPRRIEQERIRFADVLEYMRGWGE